MDDFSSFYSYGWTVVKVSPEQIAAMFLDPELKYLRQFESHMFYENPTSSSTDLIVNLVCKTGLEFLEKFVDKNNTHVYVFANSSHFSIDIKFGWTVLSFFHKHKAHVSGVVASHGEKTLHNIEVFYVDPSMESRNFYHASIYPANKVEDYIDVLNSQEFMKIEDDLTPQVEQIIKQKYEDLVIVWLYES